MANRNNKPSRDKVLLSQNDVRWCDDTMWERSSVIAALTQFGGWSKQKAAAVIYPHRKRYTIETDGCQLTCLAMVLRLLDKAKSSSHWTPGTLLRAAKKNLYLSTCGVSFVQIFADLCCDVTDGRVQLMAKEEYLAGQKGHARAFGSDSYLLRRYWELPARIRADFAAMIKIGTYDDSIASHYMLIDPFEKPKIGTDKFYVLDPAAPESLKGRPRKLSEAYNYLRKNDRAIAREWKKKPEIRNLQLAGVWIFAYQKPTKMKSTFSVFAN